MIMKMKGNKKMINEYRYYKVNDIYSVPCVTRVNGEKMIAVYKNHAYVQFADGMRIYYRRDKFSPWECIREEVFTNA